jgi:hypothetical protein
MPKVIKLTPEMCMQFMTEFQKTLEGAKMVDGKISFDKALPNVTNKEKMKVLFTPKAWIRMDLLIKNFDSEVAWHGVGERVNQTTFVINDILVYPQEVTGVTVSMDEVAYTKWLIDNIEDERFRHIIMQGHSHVNMPVTPSSVDLHHQEVIVSQLEPNGFYIFMIWNKSGARNIKIYDMEANLAYDNSEIECGIMPDEEYPDGFVSYAKTLVKKKAYTYNSGYNGAAYTGGAYAGKSGANSKNDDNIRPLSATVPSHSATEKNEPSKNDEKPPFVSEKHRGKSEVGSGWQGRGYKYAGSEDLNYLKD